MKNKAMLTFSNTSLSISLCFLIILFVVPLDSVAQEYLTVTGDIEPKSVTAGKKFKAVINLENKGNYEISELNVQISSDPCVETVETMKWPTKIYLNSSISGEYLLSAECTGDFTIKAKITYVTQVGFHKNLTPDYRNLTKEGNIGSIKINPSFPLTEDKDMKNTLTGAGITAATAAGTKGVTSLFDLRKKKKQREKDYKNAKDYLSDYFTDNDKNIHAYGSADFTAWDKFMEEGLYYLIREDPNLKQTIINAHKIIKEYDKLKPNERPKSSEDINKFVGSIDDAQKAILKWQIESNKTKSKPRRG